MAKLTQAEIKTMADDWAALGTKIDKARQAKDAEIEPFTRRFEEDTKSIREKHDKKILKLMEQQADLSDSITEWLKGHGKAVVLEGETAVAANEVKVGSRTIDPESFFKLVRSKGSEFWNCVKVEIAKAEKFLGKTEVDKISKKDTKLMPVLKVK